MRSAATSGAGGHDAPPGQLATNSGCRSAAFVLPLTTASLREQPLAQGGQRQVDLGLHEADVQIRARLDLDHGGLAVVEVGRWKPEPRPVLVDDLRRGARAGEEPDIEVRELGHEGAAHDDPGRPPRDGVACHVEDVLAFDA